MATSTEELASWLALLRAPRIGAARIRTLLASFGSASAALAARGVRWRELGFDPGGQDAGARLAQARGVADDLAWLEGRGRALLRCTDDDWPALLERIPDPPAALFVEGRANCLWQPQVAIVGSRRATRGGLELAGQFASGLVERGIAITSGLARGIDEAAHAAAIRSGGVTIAVCGTGLDVDYPRGSAALSAAIVEHGMRISEHGTGAAPLAAHFPLRNRLISGLSLGTLVIEAGLQSGSLITARLAAEQGREVFAVPGSIRNPLARGCHALIRDGARLVEDVAEVCDAIAPMAVELASAIRSRLEPDREAPATPAVQPRAPGRPGFDRCELRRFSRTRVDTAAELEGRFLPQQANGDPGRPAGPLPDSAPEPLRPPPFVRPQPAQPDDLLDAMGFDPVPLECLLDAVDLDTGTVSARLMTLELAGYVEALPGARYVRLR